MLIERLSRIAASAAVLSLAVFAAGPTFVPDSTFKGSSLDGWQPLGDVDWKAQNGEIIATPKSGGKGGWLIFDRSLQDVATFARFKCAGECKVGVLLRAEKTPDGMKGVYFALDDQDFGAYRVKLNAKGEETERTKLRGSFGQMRIAPPADPNAPAPRPFQQQQGAVPTYGLPAGSKLPIERPPATLLKNDWNQIELIFDANMVRGFLNDGGRAGGGTAEESDGRYGAVALHVAGTGEVRFQDLSYKDLGLRVMPAEQISSRFKMQKLSDFYYGWSAAAADFNKDGVMDVASGGYYYLGPDYTKAREIYLAQTYNPSKEYSKDDWVMHAHDFTGDGWPDVLTTSHDGGGRTGAILYVNPKGEGRRWEKFTVVPMLQSEASLLRDVDGDGKPELIYNAEGVVRYAKPDPAKPTETWIIKTVSDRGPNAAHGIGAGDVNGDGRVDILNAWGWWEQPAPGSNQELWKYHPEAFGRWTRGSPGGGEMAVYDVNGDGLNDVVTSLQAHGFGLAWFEQKRDANKNITFVRHMVMDDHNSKNAGNVSFSQIHGTAVADMDGDGIKDFVAGKRYWSHLEDYTDPDPFGPPVLYWFRTVRNPKAPGGAELVPELIHNRSGVGSDVLAVDLNKDGVMDVVSSTRMGTFIFWGNKGGNARAAR